MKALHNKTLTGCILIAVGSSVMPGGGLTAPKPVAAPDSQSRDMALDHYLTGSIDEEAGELLKALIEYQVAFLFDSSSVSIATALAGSYQKLGYPEAALRILETSLKVNHGESALIRQAIPLYLRADRLSDALDCFRRLKDKGELDQEDMLRYAALLQSTQEYDAALGIYRDYIAKFGGDADIYERIGLIHIARRNIDAAETCFVRLVEFDSTAYRVLFVLGGFAVAREDWATAESYFRQALAGDSTNFRVWTNLLQTLIEQRKHDECLTNVEAAMALFPDNPQLLYIKGSILERLKRYDEALTVLQMSISLDSTKTPPYLSLGFVYQQLGRWSDAADTYDRALGLDADNPVLLNNYAYMLSEWNSRLDEALQFVNHALAASPNSSSFIDTRGWIYYRMGRYKDAYNNVKQAMKGESDNAELFYHFGEISRALGRESKAKEAFRRAAELEPDNERYRQLAQ